MHEVLSRDALQMLVYMDNLAWLASSRLAYSCTLQGVQQVCASLLLQIDWRKSYSWAVLPSTRCWLSRVNPLLLPEGCELSLVNSAKDLGFCFRYRKAVSGGALRFRLQEGRLRLARPSSIDRPVADKFKLLLQGVWPMLFYGAEGTGYPLSEVASLRAKAAQAVLGSQRCQSSVLALLLLSSRPVVRMFQVCRSQALEWIAAACDFQPGSRV